MHNVNQVIENSMCTGCGLCTKSTKDMEIDGSGYLRPKLIISDRVSNLCCPGIVVSHNNKDAPYNVQWGPILSVNAGYAVDPQVRNSGSSGGTITAIAQHLIRNKKVDGVIHTGGSTENPIRNSVKISTTTTQVLENAGSRYSPSAPLAIIRSVMGNGMKYAVIGKPCDIAALRKLTLEFPDSKEQFPYLLSFMCAGVPSEKGTIQIIEKLGIKSQAEVKSFRYRGDGWPGLTTARLHDNSVHTMTYNESWGKILNRHLQTRCKVCADGIGEAADIVCADAWHSSVDGYPTFTETEGRSLVLTRTFTGERIIKSALLNNEIKLEAFAEEDIKKIQPFQVNRKSTALSRKLAIMILGGNNTKYINYKLLKNLYTGGFSLNLKAFMGTFYRKLNNKL